MWLRPCSRSDSVFGGCILLCPDCFSSDDFVFQWVDSHLVIPPPQAGMDDETSQIPVKSRSHRQRAQNAVA